MKTFTSLKVNYFSVLNNLEGNNIFLVKFLPNIYFLFSLVINVI